MTKFDVRKIPIISKQASKEVCELLEIDPNRVEAHSIDLQLSPESAPRISFSVYLTSDEVHEILAILGRNLLD